MVSSQTQQQEIHCMSSRQQDKTEYPGPQSAFRSMTVGHRNHSSAGRKFLRYPYRPRKQNTSCVHYAIVPIVRPPYLPRILALLLLRASGEFPSWVVRDNFQFEAVGPYNIICLVQAINCPDVNLRQTRIIPCFNYPDPG